MKNVMLAILLFVFLVGCAGQQNIYVDGMPINDHEYFAKTPDGLKVSFIMVRYYEKKFDDESMVYPEYLDLFGQDTIINPDKTSYLILHVKIVNVKRKPIIVWYQCKNEVMDHYSVVYQGKLPRKDLSIQLPTSTIGKTTFDVAFAGNGEELFRVWGEYTTKGGIKGDTQKELNNR